MTVLIYIVGYESNGTKAIAKYWKNKIPTPISNGAQDAVANAITLSGSDIYVAGYEITGTKSVAKYWKNTVATKLVTDAAGDSVPYSIFLK